MRAAFISIYQLEGGRGLMTGLGATLARDVPFSAVYYAVYTQLKFMQPGVRETRNTHDSLRRRCIINLKYIYFRLFQSTMGKSFSCGLVAGIIASIVTHPADVIKTSLQLFPHRYRHRTRDTVLSIYHQLGVKGFFSGIMPRLIRRSLVSALSWTVYDRVRSRKWQSFINSINNKFTMYLKSILIMSCRSCSPLNKGLHK